jgi:hypothetical protein
VVALDARERVHEIAVADHEADAPARHVVALGHGEELDRDIACPRHLHDGGRLVGIEDDIRVRQIVHHQDVVLARERDHALEEIELDAFRRRIGREAEDQHLRLGDELGDRALELGEEVDSGRHAHRADIGAGDDRAVDVDRVGGVGHQHRIAALEAGEHQVGEPLLRTDGDDRLALVIELDAVAAAVPLADRAPQPGNSLGDRIAVRVVALPRLDQLVDDVLRGRPVGIAHRQVDDVVAPSPGRHLELVGDVEDVRRQPLKP